MVTEIKPPAPWSLSDNGLMLVFHFPQEFTFKYGFLEKFQQDGYLGWLGAVMLVNYRKSGVGPYAELLFMAGLIRSNGRVAFSISKIYVSKVTSKDNGYRNWSIRKEMAAFNFTEMQPGRWEVSVVHEGKMFFGVGFKSWGPKIPITTQVIPFTRIIQQRQSNLLLTRITGSGKFQLSTLNNIYAHQEYFPPVNH